LHGGGAKEMPHGCARRQLEIEWARMVLFGGFGREAIFSSM
jgi:hypothetical protein